MHCVQKSGCQKRKEKRKKEERKALDCKRIALAAILRPITEASSSASKAGAANAVTSTDVSQQPMSDGGNVETAEEKSDMEMCSGFNIVECSGDCGVTGNIEECSGGVNIEEGSEVNVDECSGFLPSSLDEPQRQTGKTILSAYRVI